MIQRDYPTNEKPKQIEMGFLSSKQSNKHMQIQQDLLEKTIRKQSQKLLRKTTSKKMKISKISDFAAGKIEEPENQQGNQCKFEFNFFSYLGEIVIAYVIFIVICVLIKEAKFPYFQVLFVFGLVTSVSPWRLSNLLLVSGAIIIICNFYLKVQILSYPGVIICYLSLLIFNEQYKSKILFVLVLIFLIFWSFFLIPALYESLADSSKSVFYYILPLFLLILRTSIYWFYHVIGYTELIFLQLPFFIMGLQYGIILTLKTGSIQYWYLMVFFTLQIINERTQFLLRLLTSIFKSCRETIIQLRQGGEYEEQDQIKILPAHASGYSCMHSFHIICVVYFLTQNSYYSSPYSNETYLHAYTEEQWYIPIATWALVSVYEVLCLIHERKKKNILLIGHTKNTKLYTVLRGFMLAIGFWFFYMGLGIGNYIIYPQNTRLVL